ncbi:MAG: sulfotransferase, partial [Planctomycetota bacterium]
MFSRRYPYLFITGKPRSGTTWLLEIFKQHPNGHYVSIQDLNIDYDGVETLETGVFFRGFSKENIRDRFRKLRKTPFGFFVEKTPTHFQKADIIKECFPNAFILHINRNPLDVINSWLQSNAWWKSAPKTLEQAIELFNCLEKDEKRFSRFFDAEIYYEDLWNDPCRTLKPILKKMEISDFELKDMIETTRCGRSLSHSFQEKKVFRKGQPGEGQARFSKEKEHIIQCLDLRVHMKERYFSAYRKNFQCRDDSEKLSATKVENEFGIDMKHSPIAMSGKSLRKRLLLTNHHLENISGSEVTTLEMALVLKELGYDLHVATFSYGEPIQKCFKENGIKVFNVLETVLPYSEYDIAWCHHSPVLSHIVKQGVRLKNVILRTLSPYEPLEALPAYVDAIDIVLANSEETAERYYSEGWIEKEKIEVFPNSVMPVFFKEPKLRQNKTISKIAVVSNHVPDELKKAVGILRSRSVIVDILGRGGTPKLVTPDVLKPYDLIITIGKTVQFCFAMRIAVYCYDHFGGPGYMTRENYSSAEYFNYSGRCCNRKLQPDKLADEILKGYVDALDHLDCMQEIAMSRYHLVANTKSVLNRLEDFCVNEMFHGRKFTKEMMIQLVHSEYYKTLLKKYAKLQKELAIQQVRSGQYEKILREYAKLQDRERVEKKSENKNISIAIKIAAPNPQRAVFWGDYHLALALQRGLKRVGFS